MRTIRGTLAVCLLPPAVLVAGCGGGTRQDASEPGGSFALQVTDARFPPKQSLAEPTTLSITVKNADSRPLPDVAVTIDSFSRAANQVGLADQQRPVWIVDQGPPGGDTAFVSTWALGRLDPGAARTFTWKLTAIQPGRQRVRYTVSPGLQGKAKAAAGGRISGTFTVDISKAPAQARVDPNTGAVIRGNGN